MRFLRDRAVAHGTRFEALHNVFHRLNFIQGNRSATGGVQRQKPAQRMRHYRVVYQRRVLLEAFVVARLRRVLQHANGQGVYHVVARTRSGAHFVVAHRGQA